MALRHKWLDEAQTEFDETIDYLFCEFGERVALFSWELRVESVESVGSVELRVVGMHLLGLGNFER